MDLQRRGRLRDRSDPESTSDAGDRGPVAICARQPVVQTRVRGIMRRVPNCLFLHLVIRAHKRCHKCHSTLLNRFFFSVFFIIFFWQISVEMFFLLLTSRTDVETAPFLFRLCAGASLGSSHAALKALPDDSRCSRDVRFGRESHFRSNFRPLLVVDKATSPSRLHLLPFPRANRLNERSKELITSSELSFPLFHRRVAGTS